MLAPSPGDQMLQRYRGLYLQEAALELMAPHDVAGCPASSMDMPVWSSRTGLQVLREHIMLMVKAVQTVH